MGLAKPDGARAIRALAYPIALTLLWIAPARAIDEQEPPAPVEHIADLPQFSPDHQTKGHKVVLITADSLSPETLELESGQLVAWISYSPGRSTVVFERDVARSMVCHSRVNFEFEAGELRSAPIEAGEFASFCELQPGSYGYRVERSGAAGSPERAAGALEGRIVVRSD